MPLTNAEKQARRREALHAAARAAGYASWWALETAVVNGAALTVTPAPEPREVTPIAQRG